MQKIISLIKALTLKAVISLNTIHRKPIKYAITLACYIFTALLFSTTMYAEKNGIQFVYTKKETPKLITYTRTSVSTPDNAPLATVMAFLDKETNEKGIPAPVTIRSKHYTQTALFDQLQKGYEEQEKERNQQAIEANIKGWD